MERIPGFGVWRGSDSFLRGSGSTLLERYWLCEKAHAPKLMKALICVANAFCLAFLRGGRDFIAHRQSGERGLITHTRIEGILSPNLRFTPSRESDFI